MGKKTKITVCVYCGESKETTRDHVISNNLFPDSYKKKNVITVPSCKKCNKGFSLDEEYFRLFVCPAGLERSQYADELFFSKLKRCVQRRPQIISKMLNQMDLIDLYTKSGVYIGKKARIQVAEEDWIRYCNVLDKYIKGLFFHEFKKILPLGYGIVHFLGTEEMTEKVIENFTSAKGNTDNQEIYAYAFSYVPNTYESIWVIEFYRSIFFVSVVAQNQTLEQVNKSKSSKQR
jgi:hypothetical protein